MAEDRATLTFRRIPSLNSYLLNSSPAKSGTVQFRSRVWRSSAGGDVGLGRFACITMMEKCEPREFAPTPAQLLNNPLVILALFPKDAAIFAAGAIAGAAAKTVTAPLDRVKLLMQTHGIRIGHQSAKKAIGFIEAINLIVKEEGMKGYWKGNLPQVIRVLPYSAVQLLAYESYKKLFKGKDDQLSVIGRLAAGACAGMTSTLLTYPLDVLRLRLAVEPGYRTMSQVALSMLRKTDEDKEKAQEEEEADEDLEKEQEEEGSQPELQKETEVTEEQNIGEDKDAEQDKNVCNSAEECLTDQSNTKKRRTRGPTRMNKVAKRHEEKVEVEFNRLGEPVGKG